MYEKIFSCKNKVAIVTGGGGLIGKQIAQALADFGARVYVVEIDPQGERPTRASPQINFLKLNTTSEGEVKKVFKQISDEENGLDILVTCAYPKTKDWGAAVEDVPFDSWQENLNSQLGGTFICCREAALNMKKTGGGSIINMASIYGVVAPDFSVYEGTDMTMPVAYAAIKSGIIGLTRYLATYYANYDIRVNSISPGGIKNRQSDEFVNNYSKKTPLGRMGEASDIVGGVVFLASESSAYVTGQNLLIDGGWTVW